MRRTLTIKPITINERKIDHIVIDDHVKKHKDITDDLILELTKMLDGSKQIPDDVSPPYEYFVNLLIIDEKQYRLVWLLENNEMYIGIITVYRDKRRK